MAKYDVTYACGHVVEARLDGSYDSRQRRISRMREENCPKCRAASDNQAASEYGLPALVGSEKQVAWASDIRRESLPKLEEIARKIADSVPATEKDAEGKRLALQVIAEAKTQTSAKFWIDNRPFGLGYVKIETQERYKRNHAQ